MTSRRRPSSPDPALEIEGILGEILLRLPPQPSSLPRASLVCKRWRGLVSDHGFYRRFRSHHREPPILGCFSNTARGDVFFTPVLDPPDCIPAARFFPPQTPSNGQPSEIHRCRHGLALFFDWHRREAVVWHPITAHLRRLPLPQDLVRSDVSLSGAAEVLCTDGDDQDHVHGDRHLIPFQIVLVRKDEHCTTAFARIYESRSGVWGDIISTAITYPFNCRRPGVLVGNSLYWMPFFLEGCGFLELDLERKSLAVIEVPADIDDGFFQIDDRTFQIFRTGDSGLGLAILSGRSIQSWVRKPNSDGVVRWVLQKTIQLNRIISLSPRVLVGDLKFMGHVEDNNAILLLDDIGVSMIQLDSMQVKNLSKLGRHSSYYPYTSFYPAGRVIDGGDERPEIINNA